MNEGGGGGLLLACCCGMPLLYLVMLLLAFQRQKLGGMRDALSKRIPIPSELRWSVYKRDGYRCVYCGGDSDLQLDHVIPKSRGGADTYENLVSACGSCNRQKGARTPMEAGMTMNYL